MYTQDFDPVSSSLGLSSVFAVLPVLVLFVLLGGLKLAAQWAALTALGVAMLVALIVYGMPVDQTLLSASEGAVFGLFPIMWIVVTAIWIYNMTVETGHFAVLRRSFGAISDDQRVQAVIIAFCFGALLEALAGFGTPVAITAVMLIALGFQPIKAAAVALVANTAPVAFGAIAIPIVTLSEITGLPKEDLGAMVGRQTPFLALIVPLILIGMVDGSRGIRQAWPAAVVGGFTFALAQFATSNYISVELTDIVAALLATGSIVLLLRVWQPSEPLIGDDGDGRFRRPAVAGGAAHDPVMEAEIRRRDDTVKDPPGDVLRAYSPYLIVIAIFSIAQIPAIKDALAESPWTTTFQWPGLDVVNPDGEALSSLTFNFNWLPGGGHSAADLRPADNARAAGLPQPIAQGCRQLAQPAQVGDPHRVGRSGAGLRDEPVGPDDHARPLGRRGRRLLRIPVCADRLAGCRGDRLGHLVQRPLRRAAGDGGERCRHVADPARRGQQLRRRAGQDDLAPEPRDWRGRGGPGRPGGRPVP